MTTDSAPIDNPHHSSRHTPNAAEMVLVSRREY
ncbi:hypothetical protein PC118_g5673 [Phytophthora cactorum]|uniref:Uncharacterized protein n=1 Tax=Phytophthora cactorum TaxID=29920 RepID=A0A8T1GBJ4_9STRA|nr:hypothetical protein PC113_g6084 [Phytophthora cactorum]KAG2920020.1 hypothetical protein PC114_g6231 [Phytophthora cactorum]KAG2990347.1 hypothetical protein PC118_g5673 [Phytophthora cactorum]KAG3095767.1 hypothetical protein PC122_g5200 [Phytophthora cactorum]